MTTLNDTDIATCMNRYMEYMREIKIRTEVIRKTTDVYNASLNLDKKFFVTGYIETDIDLIYLQLRKIIELIMYSCVVANELAGIELTKKLRKSYQPKEIRKILQNHNNDFFPTPVKNIEDNESAIMTTESVKDGFSSFGDLETAHGKCGGILHAKRNYTYSDTHKLIEYCVNTLNSITTLLSSHWINIDTDHSFAVVMRSCKDQKVNISLMGKICSSNDPQAKIKISKVLDEL